MTPEELKTKLETDFKDQIQSIDLSPQKEVILVTKAGAYLSLCQALRTRPG